MLTLIGCRYLYGSLPPATLYAVESTFWSIPIIRTLIDDLHQKELRDPNLRECDYSRITSVILPYYFVYWTKWCIAPEFNYREAVHPDYTVFEIITDSSSTNIDIPYFLVEVKSRAGASWNKLLEQLWTQADIGKQDNGRLWVMGQKGLEICIFKFDLLKFMNDPEPFKNFEPLNLRDYTEEDLKHLDIKCITCISNGLERIAVIKWRLDNRLHAEYINDMFIHILSGRP